jgi:SAM-dependent methyltransferase
MVDVTLGALVEDAPNYRNWIVDLCAPHLVAPVLELGAGRGNFTASLGAHGAVTTVEADDLPVGPTFGSAVMINVLERIEDDQELLRAVFDRLEPGGRLCIWAPTYEFLRSHFDGELGHVRRYRKRQLEADVRSAGFEVVDGRHVNLPGWLGWLIVCRVLRRRPSPRMVRFLDAWIVPVVRWVETRVPVPIAMSVFLVAAKPAR